MMRLNSVLLAMALVGPTACGPSDRKSELLELTDADIAPYLVKLDELSSVSGKIFKKASPLSWGRALSVVDYLHREIMGNESRLARLALRPEATVLLTSTDPKAHEKLAINVICDGNYPKYFIQSLDK